jgi:hypothetical protein
MRCDGIDDIIIIIIIVIIVIRMITMRLPLIGQHRSIFIGNLGLCWIYFDRIIANASD